LCSGERSNLNLQDVRGAEIKVTDLDGTWLRNFFNFFVVVVVVVVNLMNGGGGLGDLRIDGKTLNKW
jgi:hypothetical protein